MSNNKFNQLIADPRLAAKMLARALILPNGREVAEGVWRLGKYHGRMFYYAAEPTAELKARLLNDPHAVFVYGAVGADAFEDFAPSCARRGRALSDVLRLGFDGEWLPDCDALDALAPKRTAGIIHGRRGNGDAFALRRLEWVRFFADWYAKSRKEQKAERPRWKDIEDWFEKKASPSVRRDAPTVRTLQRDIRALTSYDGKGEDLRSSDITLLWERIDDVRFVLSQSKDHPLPDVVKAAFARLGRGCDPTAIRPLPGGKAAFQEAG